MSAMLMLDGASPEEAVAQATGFFAKLWTSFLGFLPTLAVTLAVFLIGLLFARLLLKIIDRAMHKSKLDRTASGYGRSLVRIVLYVVLLIVCLSVMGVPTASMVTMVGAAGVTVGLAMQNSLSQLAGGFLLLLAKPFQAGDYIIADGEEGFVDSVTILYTKLITRDNRVVYLPNGSVSSGALVNLSQRGTLKVCVPISVSYSADLQKARAAILNAVGSSGQILQEPAPSVTVSALADSGVELSVNVWVKRADYFGTRGVILEISKQALDEAGVEIPFPQIVVHGVAAQECTDNTRIK